MNKIVSNYINDIYNFFHKTEATDRRGNVLTLQDALQKTAGLVVKAKRLGKKIMFIGNGGSAAIASHKALDFWFTGKVRSVSFSDNVNLTCISNDFGYQNIFVKQIEMQADKNDILFAISSSGNSENILLAAEVAHKRGCQVITFSGFDKTNKLRKKGDLNFYVPISHFNKVETIHSLLCDCILEIILANQNTTKDVLVAIDRDGTLIYDEDGFFGKDDNWKKKIKFYDNAIEAIKTLNRFAKVIVVTNQAGVARGLYSKDRVKEIHQYLAAQLKKEGAKIDGWYFSPYVEKKWAKDNGIDIKNPWVLEKFPKTRKPETGMLKKAASDFGKKLSSYKKVFVFGDSLDDVRLGLKAKGVSIFFQNQKNNHLIPTVESLEMAYPGRVFIVNNWLSVVKIIEHTF